MLTIIRYEYYMNNRSNLFDYIYLGENKGIGSLEGFFYIIK